MHGTGGTRTFPFIVLSSFIYNFALMPVIIWINWNYMWRVGRFENQFYFRCARMCWPVNKEVRPFHSSGWPSFLLCFEDNACLYKKGYWISADVGMGIIFTYILSTIEWNRILYENGWGYGTSIKSNILWYSGKHSSISVTMYKHVNFNFWKTEKVSISNVFWCN